MDDLTEGRLSHGFRIKSISDLPGVCSSTVEALHEASGARLFHFRADDRENFFSASFRTPPPDNTGLPHILEHVTLSGSERFPLKDPFVELLKTSMVSFMNAFTYPDRTCYPCASRNRTDFRNLMEVYCDAVFRPRLERSSLMQEGHHLDFLRPGDITSPLTVRGIVYNEMKGAYSDPVSIMEESLTRALFPDSVYGLDSGGDPDCIPDLTYGEFIEFHREFYHPSNCWIFLYGDIPTEEHMEFLDRTYLGGFTRTGADTSVALQPRWRESRQVDIPLPSDGTSDTPDQSALVTGWLTCQVTDAPTTLAMQLLCDYLMGNDASPLRKTLIDSGFGMSMVCSGYSTYRMESVFSAGLRGIDPERSPEVSALIRDTISRQAEEGLDRRGIEISLHRLELSSLEIGRLWPYNLMNRVIRSWMNDGDPLCWLQMDRHLYELRRSIDSEPGFLESVLSDQICCNPHRVDATFHPDPGLTGRRDEALQRRMQDIRKGMTEKDLNEVAENASALLEQQSTPDPPETVALLPRLTLADVDSEPRMPATEENDASGVPLLVTDVFSNGVCHVEISLGIGDLDDDLLPLVPLFCDAVIGMGAGDHTWEQMASREAACCSGLSAMPFAFCAADDIDVCHPVIRFGSRCLERNLPEMLGLISDRILRTDFTDLRRLADLIREEASEAESIVVARGNTYAVLRAARGLNRASAFRERFEGISSLREFLALAGERRADTSLVGRLERIRGSLTGKDLVCSTVCPPASIGMVGDWLAELGEAGTRREAACVQNGFTRDSDRTEGIALPVSVSYAGLSVPGLPFTHELAPALRFLSRQLGYGHLWDEIRVKRGAYGAAAVFDPTTGIFSLSSYRDPDIAGTLDTFAGIPDYIEERMDLSTEIVEASVISAIKDLDPSDRPGTATTTALCRYISGIGEEELRRHWAGLLSLSAEEIKRASSEVLRPGWMNAPICVVSSRELLQGCAGRRNFEISDLSGD